MKNRIKIVLQLVVALLHPLLLHSAVSFSALYDFAMVTSDSGTVDPTPPAQAIPGVVQGSFFAAGYVGSSWAPQRFSFQTNGLGAIDGSDNFDEFTGSLNPDQYYEFTIGPSPGYILDLDSIQFAFSRSYDGVRSYAVRSSADAFANNLPASVNPMYFDRAVAPDNSFLWLLDDRQGYRNKPGNMIILGTEFNELTSPITFRFYGWNAETDSGVFGIDDVFIEGSVMMIPEPRIVPLWIFGVSSWFLLKWRQLKGTAVEHIRFLTSVPLSESRAPPNLASGPAPSDRTAPIDFHGSHLHSSTPGSSHRIA